MTELTETPDPHAVTRLLRQWSDGDKGAMDQLMPLVYGQLRRLAAGCLGPERREHTLRATALVHEAYLRLVDSEVTFNDRIHFFAVAARVLRRILVDHAKAANRQKRGGGAVKLPLDEAVLAGRDSPPDILALDEALKSLAVQDPRKSDGITTQLVGVKTASILWRRTIERAACLSRSTRWTRTTAERSGWVWGESGRRTYGSRRWMITRTRWRCGMFRCNDAQARLRGGGAPRGPGGPPYYS